MLASTLENTVAAVTISNEGKTEGNVVFISLSLLYNCNKLHFLTY